MNDAPVILVELADGRETLYSPTIEPFRSLVTGSISFGWSYGLDEGTSSTLEGAIYSIIERLYILDGFQLLPEDLKLVFNGSQTTADNAHKFFGEKVLPFVTEND